VELSAYHADRGNERQKRVCYVQQQIPGERFRVQGDAVPRGLLAASIGLRSTAYQDFF
jgi:hypothetical protein